MASSKEDDNWETDEEESGSSFLKSEFKCGVCYELLILPTTLSCGHNFCRPCLARWYFISKKMECPVCRQIYKEKPAVNGLVRTLIEKSFKEEMRDRMNSCLTGETRKLINDYDMAVSSPQQQSGDRNMQFNWNRNRQRNAADFCTGLLFMLGIVVVIYLVWYWRNIDDGLLLKKNVIQWTAEDVYTWLSDLGTWTEPYKESFLKNTVDGRLLLAINENSLTSVLNVSKPLHQAAILAAIDSLKETGMKLPSNLWEYKSLHPGYALFLLYGIKDFPRLTLIYIYWFDYYNMFLPFVHCTCPEDDEEEYNVYHKLYEPLSFAQQIEFSTKMIFLPYMLVAKFTYDFMVIHYWTSRFVMLNCIALTIIEASSFRWLISGGWRDLKVIVKSHGQSILGLILCMIFWPIIPNFICDFFFYVALYFSPYVNCQRLYKILKGQGQ